MTDRGRFDDLYDRALAEVSKRIAAGQPVHHEDLRPGVRDPMEGTVPDEFLPDLQMADWFDPAAWAQASPNSVEGINMTGIQPVSGPGTDGNGGDWFRGREAPSNYTNRHNPLYKARREFAINIAPTIEELFGVEAGGVGYMRPPQASDSAKGGRSANSDHYSGGAIDFYGSPQQLDALRDWLTAQPFTSFIRWRSESHGGPSGTEKGAHLHVSFDVGWVAQNYFQDRAIPPLSGAAPAGERRSSSSPAPNLPRASSKPSPSTPPPITRGAPS